MSPDPRTLTLRGRRWRFERYRFVRGSTRGDCDPPFRPRKLIRIAAHLRGREELDTTVHELLHACHWDLSEDAIAETASDIATALYRLGWRRPG